MRVLLARLTQKTWCSFNYLHTVREPRAWFIQLDILFECKRITSQRTKFSNVVHQLPADMVTDLIDVIDPIPAVNPYDVLKAAIIKRTATSDEANLRQLLSGIELGDRTPSKLLSHMQHLVGHKPFDESILRQLWLQHIPLSTRQILATQYEAPLPALAEIADKIHECFPNHMVAAIPQSTQTTEIATISARLDRIELRLDKLADAISKRTDSSPASTQHRPRSSSRPTRFPSHTKNNEICYYYHTKFKDSAKHSSLPCSYLSTTNQGAGRSVSRGVDCR